MISTQEFIARRLLLAEFSNDAEFNQRDEAGHPRLFCVEHSSGKIVGMPLSWVEAVSMRDRMNGAMAVLDRELANIAA